MNNMQKATVLRDAGLEMELEFEKPYIYRSKNGAQAINIQALREYIKSNNIIKYYQNNFRIYDSGYYRLFDMASLVYMEMPENLRTNKIAVQVTDDLRLDTDILLKDCNIAPSRYICFKNGIYDMTLKALKPHTDKLIFLAQVPHNYNKNAEKCELVETFIKSCVKDDFKVRTLLLEIVGVTLSDIRCFKNWFFIQGKKDTGKSTFCGMLQNLLTDSDGIKHYTALPLTQLDESEFSLFEILGKKANIVTETEDEPIKNLTTIKKLTGGGNEELNCRVKYAVNSAKGVSRAVLIFAGNDIPKLWAKGDKLAFLKRMILFKFNDVIPKEKQIAYFEEKISYEYLIGLAVEALHNFIDNNYIFTETESIIENREEVLEASDTVYSFFKSVCCIRDGERIHVTRAYKIFCVWCYDNGYSEYEQKNVIPVKLFRETMERYGAKYNKCGKINGKVSTSLDNLYIEESLAKKVDQKYAVPLTG